jgi:hypothetical protein
VYTIDTAESISVPPPPPYSVAASIGAVSEEEHSTPVSPPQTLSPIVSLPAYSEVVGQPPSTLSDSDD